MVAATMLIGCQVSKPHYESVTDYPVKSGNVREVVYTPEQTVFSLWSPNADSVRLSLFETAETAEPLHQRSAFHVRKDIPVSVSVSQRCP